MRQAILALTISSSLVPTMVMASTAGGELVRNSEFGVIQQSQAPSRDMAATRPVGSVILAKGDKSGTGPGRGGHKGQKKGGHHGGQKHDKS